MRFSKVLYTAIVSFIFVATAFTTPLSNDKSNRNAGEEGDITTANGLEASEGTETVTEAVVGLLQVFLMDNPLDNLQNVVIRITSVEVHSYAAQ